MKTIISEDVNVEALFKTLLKRVDLQEAKSCITRAFELIINIEYDPDDFLDSSGSDSYGTYRMSTINKGSVTFVSSPSGEKVGFSFKIRKQGNVFLVIEVNYFSWELSLNEKTVLFMQAHFPLGMCAFLLTIANSAEKEEKIFIALGTFITFCTVNYWVVHRLLTEKYVEEHYESTFFLGLPYGIFLGIISNIICFALVYILFGMTDGCKTIYDPLVAIYFSIVTWTTLGYGDLHPTDSIRLFAAFEALMGYIYMAIFIGIFLTRRQDVNEKIPQVRVNPPEDLTRWIDECFPMSKFTS